MNTTVSPSPPYSFSISLLHSTLLSTRSPYRPQWDKPQGQVPSQVQVSSEEGIQKAELGLPWVTESLGIHVEFLLHL